jgi:anti-sigma regulatory factor (Ser/Thr protein kinase)/biotin operon repressor
MTAMADGTPIRSRALELIAADGRDVAARLGAEFGISRQAVARHLRALVAEGAIAASGATRARMYRLLPAQEVHRSYVRDGLREDHVWQEVFAPVVAGLPENVRDAWRYGVTEMVNNAIDHSGSAQVHVGIVRTALATEGWVADDGEGIFRKIQHAFDLYDAREAMLELVKGKLTTDPARHTGEGIFFASRAFDSFDIASGTLHFVRGTAVAGWAFERPADAAGTLVRMRLGNASTRRVQDVFTEFAGPEEYAFVRTEVPVRLAQYEGEKLVSRSQARRLCTRLERFREVVLDFAGVSEIGQAFADEVFRVFALAHPGVRLEPINMGPAVDRMVRRARQAASESTPPGGPAGT